MGAPANPQLPKWKRWSYYHSVRYSWLALLLAVVWVFLYPVLTISTFELKPRGTYFSENALLIRSMAPEVSSQDIATAETFHKAYLSQPDLPAAGCLQNCLAFQANLLQAIAATGAEPYTQTYYQKEDPRPLSNLYGILRAAPFGEGGKESILLISRFSTVGSESTVSDFSLALALMQHLSTVKWLSKDVILLLADDGNEPNAGVRAWLQAYHSHSQTDLRHAGTIRGALVLEIDSSVSELDLVAVLGAGINGQLPNLDLINTAVYALKSQRIPILLDRCGTTHTPCTEDLVGMFAAWLRRVLVRVVKPASLRDVRYYVNNLTGLFRFMKTVATGPNGPHAECINYNIDAITLLASKKHKGSGYSKQVSSLQLLKAVELIVRALSNLEEKFHQSFYFYLLPNDHHFVSIGEYYFAVALLLLPSLARLLNILSSSADIRMAFGLLSTVLVLAAGLLLLELTKWIELYPWLGVTLALEVLAILLIVRVLHPIPILQGSTGEAQWHAKIAQAQLDKDNAEALKEGIVLDSDEQKAQWLEWERLDASGQNWTSLKIFALLLLIFANSIVGILNFSLALLLSAITVPFSLIVSRRQQSSRVRPFLMLTFLVLSSPVVLCSVLDSTFDSLSYFVTGYHQMGLFPLPYLCCIYIPVHTLMSSVFLLS